MYIGIPISALICYVFLFFSTLNVNSEDQLVKRMRMVLTSCILWTGGATLMRLQIGPGINFWFHISIFGLLLIPTAIFLFIYEIADVKRSKFLFFNNLMVVVLNVLNIGWSLFVPPPTAVIGADGTTAYLYDMPDTVVILAVYEIAVVGYVVIDMMKVMIHNGEVRRKMLPVLIGIGTILVGNLLVMIPGNLIPFDTLGGVGMAFCFVYAIYKKSLFDISTRALIGIIYMSAMLIVILPLWNISVHTESLIHLLGVTDKEFMILYPIVFATWAILFILLARNIVLVILRGKEQEQMERLERFQKKAITIFDEQELFEEIEKVVTEMFPKSNVSIFKHKAVSGDYELISTSDETTAPNVWEQQKAILMVRSSEIVDDNDCITLEYDNDVVGFIYVKHLNDEKRNYIEKKLLQQLGSYSSICLKNINTYQKVYQISIHDDLTGLYNRTYFQSYLDTEWEENTVTGLIYLDLDDFRLINELYGEQIGDDVLHWTAGLMKEATEGIGEVFRVGSNEMLIVTKNMAKESVIDLAKEVRRMVAEETDARPQVLQAITFSIGVAMYPEMAGNAKDLLAKAKLAVYFAKNNGKNRIEVYERALEEEKNLQNDAEGSEKITSTIYALMATIDAKDTYTFEHSCNVSEYAVALAKEIGLKNEEIKIVKEAGLLHDIGKIGIPEDILKKRGRLTNKEYDTMKKHVMNSIKMIHYLPNMNYLIPAVVSHHERYDGNGYPRGTKGEDIPLLGRILAVCDSFEAMTARRPYKNPLPVEYAVEELRKNRGTQFDPELADVFIRMVEEGKIVPKLPDPYHF